MDPIYRTINILANKQRREFEKKTESKSYSGAEGRVLDYLLKVNKEEVFQKDIEREFGLRPPTATTLLHNMEKRGLIERFALNNDARYKTIVLTEKAMQLKDALFYDMNKMEQKMLRDISQEDLKIWNKVSHSIIENLAESRKENE